MPLQEAALGVLLGPLTENTIVGTSFGFARRYSCLFADLTHDAKADEAIRFRRRHDGVIDQARLADEDPVTPAHHLDVAGRRSVGIVDRRAAVVTAIEPVGTPFPDIAPHVE